MIIIFEGSDKCGKGTLIKALHKATNYEHIIIDRFIGSNVVYTQFHKRKNSINEYYWLDKIVADTGIFKQVMLFANKKDLEKRFKQHNEKDIAIKDVNKAMKMFRDYALKTKIKTLVLDTSRFNETECLDRIMRFIKC